MSSRKERSGHGGEASGVTARLQTRRALLGKAALAGGGFGLGSLGRPRQVQGQITSAGGSILGGRLASGTSAGQPRSRSTRRPRSQVPTSPS
jgi:hypothetical protein